jgi:LacI family transcriptional regulator
MKKIPKVILLTETTHAYGRGLLRGIAKYSKLHGPWSFYREAPFYGHFKQLNYHLCELKKINADGIIIREPTSDQIDQILKIGLPLIISPNQVNPKIPTILTNAEKIGQLAAEHLLERGFKNFAYCGFEEMQWAKNRYTFFAREIEQRNYHVNTFFATVRKVVNPKEKDQAEFAHWLHSLPKPVGLLACNDDMGRIILEACNASAFSVPEQITVVGVDDDDLTCELTDPPLSSIALHSEKAGYDAAALLDRLMNGEKMNGQIILQDPSHVVTRQSSDIIAVNDQDVAHALVFIREHYKDPITVENVANEVNLSRRHLYKKFKETLGRSVHKEIKNMRIEHICKLLTESDLSIYQIAMSLESTGIEHLARYFQNEKGITPQEYRKKFRYPWSRQKA